MAVLITVPILIAKINISKPKPESGVRNVCDGACTEGHALRQLGDDVVDVKDLKASVGVLPLFAVDEAPDGELGRISLELIRRDDEQLMQ